VKPMTGASFVPTMSDPACEPTRTEQFLESGGHRGFYRDGWEIVTLHRNGAPFDDDEWQLYHLAEDPTERSNLAEAHPERVKELSEAWEAAAWEGEVFPLDDFLGLPAVRRPNFDEPFIKPVTLYPGTPTLERWRSAALVQYRSFSMTVRLDHDLGAQGVLVAHGDQGGGYILYVEDGELFFIYNEYGNPRPLHCGSLGPGYHEIVADFTAPGAKKWNIVLSIDGERRNQADDLDMLLVLCPLEGINIGIDRRSPVSWELSNKHGCFPYAGSLQSVTYTPGPFAPDAHQVYLQALVEQMLQYE